MDDSNHYIQSSFRENLIEHLFVGELLKLAWQREKHSIEISKPEVDRSGYDFIAECNGYIRHIQLKSSFRGANTSRQNVSLSLTKKPSGCVIWVYFDLDSLELGPFLYLGADPGKKLPNIETLKIAKHTKANTQGMKSQRPNYRVVPKGKFISINSIQELWLQLFG